MRKRKVGPEGDFTIDKGYEVYYEFTGKASELARKLAFAGLAIVWLFKTGDKEGQTAIPFELFWPSFWLVAAIASDLLQYVVNAEVWGGVTRWHEWRKHEKFSMSVWFIRASTIFYYVKLGATFYAYYLLMNYLINRAFDVNQL